MGVRAEPSGVLRKRDDDARGREPQNAAHPESLVAQNHRAVPVSRAVTLCHEDQHADEYADHEHIDGHPDGHADSHAAKLDCSQARGHGRINDAVGDLGVLGDQQRSEYFENMRSFLTQGSEIGHHVLQKNGLNGYSQTI